MITLFLTYKHLISVKCAYVDASNEKFGQDEGNKQCQNKQCQNKQCQNKQHQNKQCQNKQCQTFWDPKMCTVLDVSTVWFNE